MRTPLAIAAFLALFLMGCGSVPPHVLSAAQASVTASRALVDRLCEIDHLQAHSDQERADADLRCLTLRASHDATAIAVETWSAATEEPICPTPSK